MGNDHARLEKLDGDYELKFPPLIFRVSESAYKVKELVCGFACFRNEDAVPAVWIRYICLKCGAVNSLSSWNLLVTLVGT